MFVQIEDNYLKMNRGDTYTFPLIINEGTKLCFKQYQLRQFDKIYVGIMEPNQSFENAIIRKVITITSPTNKYGHPLVKLTPQDTEYLLTGKYFIEIKLVQQEDNESIVTTILPLKEFFINGTNKSIEDLNSNLEHPIYVYNKSVNKVKQESEWEYIKDLSEENPCEGELEWGSI